MDLEGNNCFICSSDFQYKQCGSFEVYHPEGYKSRSIVGARRNGFITFISNVKTCQFGAGGGGERETSRAVFLGERAQEYMA